MESQVRETCAVVKRVEAAIPQDLGPWVFDHKVVYLDDALGRLIPIPFELCHQWEVCNTPPHYLCSYELIGLHICEEQLFNETLKLAFRERPGISWVNAGKFTIKTQRHKLLLPGEWGQIVKPSMTLLMSVVIARNTHNRTSCPSCSASNPTALLSDDSDLAQVQW